MNVNGIGLTSPNVNVNGINTSGYGDKNESADIPEASPKKNRDEYIPSEEDKSIGLYRPAEDKEGTPYIEYDAPEEDSGEECTANTDRVDREIKKLEEKEELFRSQLRSASEDKRDDIEKQLEAVEKELALKDNDSYRRENADFSRT